MTRLRTRHRRRGTQGMWWTLLVIGAIPFCGFAIQGSWNQAEMGIGGAVFLFAASQLLAEWSSQRPP